MRFWGLSERREILWRFSGEEVVPISVITEHTAKLGDIISGCFDGFVSHSMVEVLERF